MNHPSRPTRRDQFRIAIICALPREADAVTLLFDHFWDNENQPCGKAPGDNNHYITGRIGPHNIVLTTLPDMGTTSAAAAAANLRSSYEGLKIALLVGVCGGLPSIEHQNAFLGDVVISKSIIQYDYGRRYPGQFIVKNTVENSLGRANRDVRAVLSYLATEHGREQLQLSSTTNLQRLQKEAQRKRRRANYTCPGRSHDHLFASTYMHRHQAGCEICASEDGTGAACDAATKASCAELGCDDLNRVQRQYPADDGAPFTPEIFIGKIGSGNAVMKSGIDRDRIAAEHGIIAFEMEGAGVWDEVPCIVVKGICDYADSHKNKIWQDFAAATAASVARAIIGRYEVDDDAASASSDNGADSRRHEATVQNLLPSSEAQGGNRTISGSTIGQGAWVNLGDIHR